MALEVTVVDGVSTSPNVDCWRMIYNVATKKVTRLEQGIGVTKTKSGLYCDTTKEACLEYAASQTFSVPARLLEDSTE